MAATTLMLSSIVATSGDVDPIVAEAAAAGDSQKPRGNQFGQVTARRRARDIGAVRKLSGRQRLAAHKASSLAQCHPRERPLPPDSPPRPSLTPIADNPEANPSKTVRHELNCPRETIANLAARMRCSPSLAGALTVGMEDEMVAYWVARSKVNNPDQYKKYADLVPGILQKFGGSSWRAAASSRSSRARTNSTASSSSSSRASRRRSPATNCPNTLRPRRTARRTKRASWRSSSSRASETYRHAANSDVGFTRKSGHRSDHRRCPLCATGRLMRHCSMREMGQKRTWRRLSGMTALPPKADIRRGGCEVR